MPTSASIINFDNIQNSDEKKIALLFQKFELTFYGLNNEIKDDRGNVIGEIDIICGYDDYIFLIEVKNTKHNVKDLADHWFSRWSNDKNISYIKSQVNIPDFKIKRIFIDLQHDNGEINLASIQHILIQENNHYIYKDDITYFDEIYDSIGKIARNDFFNYIKLPRKNISKPIKAIMFYIDNIPAYSFIARVDELLEICYIERRINKEEGYQRALDYSRIASISKDILDKKILAFPNSILVNSENIICKDIIKKQDCPAPTTIQFPQSFCEFKVVDGQHRLLGFSKLDDLFQKNSYLPVIAFEKMPIEKELKMFIDINSKQKKVDSNLVFLLKKGFPWTENDEEYYEKIAVLTILNLEEEGPLKGKIYLGTAKEKKKDKPIKLSSLVYILKNNGFIRKNNPIWQKSRNDTSTPLTEIKKVISAINKNLKSLKHNNEPFFFFQNMGLRIIFRLIKVMEYNKFKGNIIITNEKIIEDLKNIMIDEVYEELKNSYGEGGANISADYLCKKLIDQYPDKYNKIELDLKKIKYRKRQVE